MPFVQPSVAQVRRVAHSNVLPNSPRLIDIKVTGSKRFSAAELMTVTGLKLGQDANDDDLKKGADMLASSGMFYEITYSFVSAPQGTRLEYRVTDADGLLPAAFDNFVWMSRDEVLKAVQQRTPLFRGELPNAGEMYTQVAADLKSILQERGIKADVLAFPQAAQHGGKITGFLYQVRGVKIPIHDIEFPGASDEMVKMLQKTAASQNGSDYSESMVRTFAAMDLLPLYRMRGLLRAEFDRPQATLVDAATNSVSVKVPVREGLRYDLERIEWSGNTAYPASEFQKVIKIQLGKPANAVQFDEDLGAIGKIYGTKGYLTARLENKPVFDDAAQKVVFQVTVHEGDQYRMGNLVLQGVGEPAATQLRNNWKLKSGDVFDTSYIQLYFAGLARQFDLNRLEIETRNDIHRETRTVDVTIRIAPKTQKQ